MAIPSVDLCGWAVTDVILPVMNKANKEKPIDDLINKGWDMNESPAADEFNYLFNNHYQWINYLKTDIAPVVVNATSSNTPNTIVKRDGSGNFSAGAITANLSGNASTSTTLQTARTISAGTAVTATPTSFNGSANITIPITSLNAAYLVNTVPVANMSGTYNISISGNSATATSLQTARTITLSNKVSGSASFDGSSNVNISCTIDTTMSTLWTGSATGATIDLTGYSGKEIILCAADSSDIVVFENIPVNFITSVKTSGLIYIDYGDSSDFSIDYSVSGTTVTFSNLQRGNLLAIYGR